jgi:hypothetical protein
MPLVRAEQLGDYDSTLSDIDHETKRIRTSDFCHRAFGRINDQLGPRPFFLSIENKVFAHRIINH